MKRNGTTGLIVWASVTGFLFVLFLVVTILCSTVFYPLINIVLKGPRPIFKPGVESYYLTDYMSKDQVLEAARDFNVELAGEGYVMLKNSNGALPIRTPESEDDASSDRPKVSVFGKNSVDLAYGGTGSGEISAADAVDIYDALEAAGYDCNPALREFYEDEARSGAKRETSGEDLDSGDTVVLSTAETPQEDYDDEVKSSYGSYKDAAIVVFTRVGGEGMDFPRSMKGADGYKNEDDHFLELDRNEIDLINAVKAEGFGKVVVMLNTGCAMEIPDLAADDGVDAVIWTGYPGMTGMHAFASILNGNVNPSGHTVDTWVKDLKKDPTWNNFGDNLITANYDKGIVGGDQYSVGGKPRLYYFVDYEEGVYVGYRYYETRGVTDGEEWYNDNVLYPFGHGLSYTDFTWTADFGSLKDATIDGKTKYTVTVTVHNDGDVAGKDVVQLYGHAPYTAGGVEKSEVVLLDFAKTELIEPGEDAEVTLTFDPYLLASYDYSGANDIEGTGYELDGGDGYALYVAENAHDRSRKVEFSVPSSGVRYENDPVTDHPVVNRYTDQEDPMFDSDAQLSVLLSRSDWTGTWPTVPTDDEREVDESLIEAFDDTSHNNPADFDSVEMPWTEEPTSLTLRGMLFNENGEIIDDDGDGIPFVSYDDERWDALLDQLSFSEMVYVCNNAAFFIQNADSVSLPIVLCADGPAGWTCFMNEDFTKTCGYVSQITVGSTWSKELSRAYGETIGDEGIVGDGAGTPYTGWYAPGANIHRSAFGGRNFEYYSEDPVLSGKLAANQIAGCQSKGVFCFIKHFAVNDQETHRSISGLSVWVTEQSMREIYLRPFELAVKEGGSRAIMSSFNRIGTRWTGGDYRLLTEILRNEWGFRGSVICDYNTIPKYMNSRQMSYAGGDLNLASPPVDWADEASSADVYVLRGLMKNILYTVVNSNAMNVEVIGYKMPIWQIVLIVVDCVVAAGCAVWGVFAVRGFIKSRKPSVGDARDDETVQEPKDE